MIRCSRSGANDAIELASWKSFSPPVGNQVPGTVPFWFSMQYSRRGTMPWAKALRPAGDMASRKGRAMPTPAAPRNRVRRDRDFITGLP